MHAVYPSSCGRRARRRQRRPFAMTPIVFDAALLTRSGGCKIAPQRLGGFIRKTQEEIT